MTDEIRVDETTTHGDLYELLHQEKYTPEEAAHVLNMRLRTILAAAFGGDLKAEIISGDVISITRTDLVAWLKWRENH